MKIAFAYSPEGFGPRAPIDFEDVEDAGLTGTDLVTLYYAKEMAARGHEVDLFLPNPSTRSWGFVGIHDFTRFAEVADDYDVAIASSSPNALVGIGAHVLRCVNRQVGPFGGDCRRGFDDSVDLYFCPSRIALERVSAPMPEASRAKFRHLPNGCYPHELAGTLKIPGRCIYTSSPDRGLHLLLWAWPHVRRAVPEASLRIFYYDLERWLALAGGAERPDCEETRCARYIRHAFGRFAEVGGLGVERVGGVSHRQISREISQAMALTFPTDCREFTETFSVATLEACAAGAVPLISTNDALGGIYGEALGDAITEHPVRDRMGDYVAKIVRALTDEDWRREVAERTRPFAEAHAWPRLAADLEWLLTTAIAARGPGSAPRVRISEPPTLQLVLTSYASGDIAIDIDDPKSESTGGGCRAGFAGLVKAIAAPELGYRVRAFGKFTRYTPGETKDGVEYLPLDDYRRSAPPAAVLAYYDTSPLERVPSSVLRIASHHTFRPPSIATEWTDVHLAPSQYAADVLQRCFDDRAPWCVMPNGVGDLPEWAPVAGRVIYHTSPDRGLHLLVECWPYIKERVPHATLHVVGGAERWAAACRGQSSRQGRIAARFEIALRRARKAGGVELLGFVPRPVLERELAEAQCFAFPCAPVGPCETFSVSVMEACKVGVPVVLSPADALESIYGSTVILAPNAELLPQSFADEVVRVLLAPPEEIDWVSMRERHFAKKFTFAAKARALDRVLRRHLPAHLQPRRESEPVPKPDAAMADPAA